MPIDGGGPTPGEMGVDPASVAPAAEVNPAEPVAPVDPAAPPEPADLVLTPPVADADPAADVDPTVVPPAPAPADADPAVAQPASSPAPENGPAPQDAATQEFLARPREEQLDTYFSLAKSVLGKAGVKYEPSTSTEPAVALSENRRNLLTSLRNIPKDNPEYDRAQALYNELSKDIKLVGENGESGNLAELQAELENPATTAERKTQIEGLISNGKYTTEFDDTRKPKEVVEAEFAAKFTSLKAIEEKLRSEGKTGEADKIKVVLDNHRIVSEGKGPLGVMGKAGWVNAADLILVANGDAGMTERVAENVNEAWEDGFAEYAHHLRSRNLSEQQIRAVRDYLLVGRVDEVIKIPGAMDNWVAEKFFGRKIKNSEDLNKFINSLISEETRKELMKRYGAGTGIVAILMLAAAMSLKDMGANALSGGGGR